MRAPMNKRWRGLLGALLATGTIAGFAAVAISPPAHAAFPGTNGPIVFSTAGSFGSSSIFKWDPANPGTTTQIGTVSTGDRPAVSPDGTTVAYSGPFGGGIFLIGINGTPSSGPLGGGASGGCFDPSFANATTVVAQCGSDFKTFQTTGNAVGTITPGGSPFEPEVSPDGTTIAYVDTSIFELFTIPVSGGSGPTKRTVGSNIATDQVSWSPDGTKVAVQDSACNAATGGIAVVSIGVSTTPNCLGGTATGDTDPSWSPDGTTIAASNANKPVLLPAAGGSRVIPSTNPSQNFVDNFWATAVGSTTTTTSGVTTTTTAATTTTTTGATTTTTTPHGTTTTTPPPPPCTGTLTGSAFKGAHPKPKKALAGVIVTATQNPSGPASSATTNSAGAYSMTVPCGTYTKTSTGPATNTRVCHFGDKSGPTNSVVTVTNGSVDIENLFCKRK